MSLQLVMGSSGAGKSHFIYQKIITKSLQSLEQNYLVLVPEQFTMQTQKKLVSLHPSGAIMNIDVLSFGRLAYRIFEEVGKNCPPILEETGKSFVLQKVAKDKKKELAILGSSLRKPGYIQEMKSMISELMQYRIDPVDMDAMIEKSAAKPLLNHKLKDVQVVYQGFRDYLKDRNITQEEVLGVLSEMIGESVRLKGSVVVLDGFTGFTPVQYRVIEELLKVCSKIYVTVTLDERENPWQKSSFSQLFHMSKEMIQQLRQLVRTTKTDMDDELWVKPTKQTRFQPGGAIAFLEQNLFRRHQGTYQKEQTEIHMMTAANPLAEMEEVSRQIKQLVREQGYRYKDVAVITGDLESYGAAANLVFPREEIPFFMDQKHSVMMNPFVEYLRAAMDMAVSNLSYESVFRYLRSGMSNLTAAEIDQLENYVIALGIRGLGRYEETWVRNYRGLDKTLLVEINRIREQFLAETRTFIQAFCEKDQTVLERTRSLYTFVADNHIQEKLKVQEYHFQKQGEAALVKEYAQVYGIIMNLLDKVVEVLGDEVMKPVDYQQLLEAGFQEAQVGLIPPSADQVLVGDMERTRLADIKALFFVGVNDGIIPKNTGNGGILSETERDFLKENDEELSPGARERMYMQRFYLYLNMTKPSQHLYLSYARTSGSGESRQPAYLIGLIKKMFQQLTVREAASGQERLVLLETPTQGFAVLPQGLQEILSGHGDSSWLELFRWFYQQPKYQPAVEQLLTAAFYENDLDGIGKSTAQALYGKALENSATRLEQFSACAFAHFLQYGLHLQERVRYEFNAMDMGNVMHEALERFAGNLAKAGMSWEALADQERNRLIDGSVDEIIDDYGNTILHSSARNEYMIARVKRMMRRTVWALQEQIKCGDFTPGGFEISFAMEDQLEAIHFALDDEATMRLRGRIDRLDTYEDDDKVYVKVIDYKSGSQSLNLIELYHGLQLQLLVYLNAALELEQKKHPDKEVAPAGVFYYNIKDPVIAGNGSEGDGQLQRAILKDLCMNGLVTADMEVLQKLDHTLDPVGNKSSYAIPVTLNKDGGLTKSSAAVDADKFQMLSRYVNRKVRQIAGEIIDGKVAVAPYQLDKKNACTYCPYHGVCGFEERICGYDYRRLESPDAQALWQLLEKEVQ